jgi:hypothetical protein
MKGGDADATIMLTLSQSQTKPKDAGEMTT